MLRGARDRLVVVVAGPPCAGKTTLVDRLRRPGDLVVDHDRIAQALGSDRAWHHDEEIRREAEWHVHRLFRAVAAMNAGRAWVVRTVPVAADRVALARRLRADRVLVLLPPVEVLMARAERRPRPWVTKRTIRQWLARYRPAPVDELVTDPDVVVV